MNTDPDPPHDLQSPLATNLELENPHNLRVQPPALNPIGKSLW
jgi:hypothetical protein